jgi:polyisoprenoid-binding protein YceI
MKIPAFFLLSLLSLLAHGQDKFITRTGHIWFYSTTPIENIEAHNRQVNAAYNSGTGEFVANVLMRSFQFEKALMQEHFNENYVESSKFPKGTFKGKVLDAASLDLKENKENKVKVEGELTIHGVTQKVITEGTIKKIGEDLIIKAKFPISPKDYNIKIPKVVEGNIAKTVDVNVDLILTKVK